MKEDIGATTAAKSKLQDEIVLKTSKYYFRG
jgi:hypothetical protein